MSVTLAIHKWIEQRYVDTDVRVDLQFISPSTLLKASSLPIRQTLLSLPREHSTPNGTWIVSYDLRCVQVNYRVRMTVEEAAKDPRVLHPKLFEGLVYPSHTTIVTKVGLIHYSDPEFFAKLDEALERCRLQLSINPRQGLN